MGGKMKDKIVTKSKTKLTANQKELLERKIFTLNLSWRSENCLLNGEISTIGELVARKSNDLLAINNFGKTSLKEVERKLKRVGLTLGMTWS